MGDNKTGIPGDSNENTPGFGERYKVRIMGHHTAVPSELSDDELPWKQPLCILSPLVVVQEPSLRLLT